MSNREETTNDHRERLNRVLVFIQRNIDKPLQLETLATVAHLSPFHFHRIFSAHVGESLNGHIRRLRLEKAAQKLVLSADPVTDIALSTGYETSAAFTRAFKQHFGKNPTDYQKMRKNARPIQNGQPCRQHHPRRKMATKAEIRTLPEQNVLFARKTGPYDKAAGDAWGSIMKFAYSHRLMNKDTKCLGISHDSPDITPEERIRYDACVTFKGSVKPEGEVGIQTIAGGRYAVFVHKGPYKNFSKTYDYIMAAWYPESGERFRDLPCFEVYLNRDPRKTKPENLKTEIYVPIE